MRRRSNTIYAQSFENYLDASKHLDPIKKPFFRPNPKRMLKKRDDNTVFYEEVAGDQDDDIDIKFPKATIQREDGDDSDNKPSQMEEDHWSNFDFDCEGPPAEPKECRVVSGTSSLAFSENTVDTENAEEEDGRYSIPKRVMVVGLNNCGKRSLINSLFECNEPDPVLNAEDRVMDLLIKTEQKEDGKEQIRYQFWLRNLFPQQEKDQRFDDLFRIYYRNVSLFIFVYSITDRGSLDYLDGIINEVKKEVPLEKFTSLLIGTKKDLGLERQVSYQEGCLFQEIHKLDYFLEAGKDDKSLKQKMIRMMNREDQRMEVLEPEKKESLFSI